MEPSPGKEWAGGKIGLAEGLDRTDGGPEGALWENPRGQIRAGGLRPKGQGCGLTKDFPHQPEGWLHKRLTERGVGTHPPYLSV